MLPVDWVKLLLDGLISTDTLQVNHPNQNVSVLILYHITGKQWSRNKWMSVFHYLH